MRVAPENCFHLTVEIVREIHGEAIAKFGGSDGVRDLVLLESAVAAPQSRPHFRNCRCFGSIPRIPKAKCSGSAPAICERGAEPRSC